MDRQTNRQTDTLIAILCIPTRSRVIAKVKKILDSYTTTTTKLLLKPFYSPLGFVWDYLGEPAPERSNEDS